VKGLNRYAAPTPASSVARQRNATILQSRSRQEVPQAVHFTPLQRLTAISLIDDPNFATATDDHRFVTLRHRPGATSKRPIVHRPAGRERCRHRI
jgi:hypothetical protein